MQRPVDNALRMVSEALACFLEGNLPMIGGADWWQTHVLSQLTYGQQGQVRTRGIDRLGGLDLAALIRVFDRNWAELSYQAKLPNELRTHVKELADIRNAMSHTAADGAEPSPNDAYRYLDTMARVLRGLSADTAALDPVEAARIEVMRIMAGAPAPAIEPVIEIREVVKEVIKEVPVEVIKEVRVAVAGPPASAAEPEGGIEVGDFRLHGPGDALDGTLPGFDGKDVEATLIPWTVYGDGGLCLSIQVAMLNEGTAKDMGQVACTSRNQSPQVWDDVVQRLRIGIRDAGEGMWTMELRSAVRPGGARATRNVWSLSEFHEKTGLSLESALKSYGAEAVGTRGEIHGDTGKNRNFPCVLFAAGDSLVPAAAWTLVTLATLQS